MKTAIAALVLTIAVGASAPVSAGGAGGVRGTVADISDGVLPGVTVEAAAPDGRLLASTVSDGVGEYVLSALPAGPVDVTFRLDGFEPSVVRFTVEATRELQAPVQHLEVARLSETVHVYARAPEPPPPVPLRAPDPILPPPVVMPLPEHDRASVCGPARPDPTVTSVGTVTSLRRDARRLLYAKDDQVTIAGGALNGLTVGRNLAVRRYYPVTGTTGPALAEHTAGVVQIVSADERTSIGVVIYACDEIRKDDFLAPFVAEPVRAPDPAGIPVFYDAARILFADEGQMLGAPDRLMVIDRGGNYGMAPGQRLTIFRRERRGSKPLVLGGAIVVALRGESATIRIEQAVEPILVGDWVASQRPSVARSASGRR